MGMMKRARVDEVQYGQQRSSSGGSGSGSTGHHRILTTQHGGNSTIQYQLQPTSPAGVLKSGSEGGPSSGSGNVSNLGQQPPMQYSTFGSPITSSNISSKGVSQSSGGSNTGPGVGGSSPTAAASIHVSNTGMSPVNSIRHKNLPPGSNPSMNPQVGTIGSQPVSHPPRLKVEDALSYLDQVKYQYADQPQIYNNFLDIMKEFKSQCIDTPGVIQRVSNLFKGHPDLIYGFNMFLPPGYKIEIQSNDQGISVPVVSMPSPPGGSGSVGTISCLQQSSPAHKNSSIVHQISSNTVNLMTHSGSGAVGTPSGSNLSQNLHTNLPPPQQSPASQLTSSPVPQNYSRDRDRTISQSASLSVGPPMQGPSSGDLSSPSGHNLHHISQSILQGETSGQQNQPVEFNHAITYVNKIKSRFQNTPEKYKKFLEILHTYQKEQKILKEGSASVTQKTLTEAEVYAQVAKLFDQQEDLLREFGQFLPDATNHSTAQYMTKAHSDHKKMISSSSIGSSHSGPSGIKNYNNSQNCMNRIEREHYDKEYHIPRDKDRNHIGQKFGHNSSQAKKSPSHSSIPVYVPRRPDERDSGPPNKRHKPICRDVTLAEASRYGTLTDAAFFDKVRKALRSPEVYENFLRCLTLFNQEIISKSELLSLVSPFLSKFPELHRWFQDFFGPPNVPECISMQTAQRQDRNQGGELAQEIDLSSCKRLGASYCALPKTNEPKRCSGRTSLCREVLNDTWVSFPTWASEDSTFVTSRKTQFEEIIYRCEDERFELDVVIETNSSTIQVLESVQKKLSRMPQEEQQRYRLDDCLGGYSPTIHQRALKRIYGDKANEIILGLKKNPFVSVPIVLKRLKSKEEEWREAQKNFNKQWREQYEKYYLKSLDHQAINFKPNDIKALRSKSLFNEIETLYDERHEQNEDSPEPINGPHLILPYKDKTILDDATNLLIHHVKRQTGIQKQEKTKIKHILRQFVPDLFFAPRQPLSDDEKDDVDEKDMEVDLPSGTEIPSTQLKGKNGNNTSATAAAASTTTTTTVTAGPSTSAAAVAAADNAMNLLKIKCEDDKDNISDIKVMTAQSNNSSGNIGTDLLNVTNSFTTGTTTVSTVASNSSSSNTTTTTNCANNREKIKEESKPKSPQLSQHAEEAYTLFFANNNWYLFFRLHAILCERLRTMYDRARILLIEEEKYRMNRSESTATALRLKQKNDVQVEDYYPTFLEMLKNVLDGNMDSNSYEDSLREMFGIHAYIAFTLDRVVSNAVRQLQHCVTERGALECVELFHAEQRKGGAGGSCRNAGRRVSAELAYQRKAEASLQDENCFKIYIYKIDCRVTIELLDTENEDVEKNVTNAQSWNKYVERLSNPAISGNNPPQNTSNSSGGSNNKNATSDTSNTNVGNTGSTSEASKLAEIKTKKGENAACRHKTIEMVRDDECVSSENLPQTDYKFL